VRSEISGKISVNNGFVAAVKIINLATSKEVVSNSSGYFSVLVSKGDVLVFSAFNLETVELKIIDKHFKDNFVAIIMNQKNNQLEEVVINQYAQLNEKTLGIVPDNQKKYTQAERKLQTAGDFKPIMLLGLLGGSMPLDPLINKINGRTKRLKKELVVEGKITSVVKLQRYFDENYYIENLKIPIQYVDGFKIYIIENDKFASQLKNNNVPMMTFLIIDLANKYKEIIACENE
jgi:hypothetical protein